MSEILVTEVKRRPPESESGFRTCESGEHLSLESEKLKLYPSFNEREKLQSLPAEHISLWIVEKLSES